MRVGVPKEIKTHEYRVGLTPGAVREYVSAGHNVVVEVDAGGGIGAGDEVSARQARPSSIRLRRSLRPLT
jgi:alanine dehydrogenase